MKKWIISGIFLLGFVFCLSVVGKPIKIDGKSALPFEARCGWFYNPTPANMWLRDRDGEWLIGIQGGYQVKGDWPWPVFEPHEWIKTNGHYGYGCVCFKLQVDRKSHHVTAIKRAKAKPIAVCQQDPDLNKSK